MRFTSVALASLAGYAFAYCAPSSGYGSDANCLCQSEGEDLAARYAAVIAQQNSDIGTPVETAQQIIAKNYLEQSDSANQQIGIPLGQLTVDNKQTFIVESQANPPIVAETIRTSVCCDKVIWQWRSVNFGSGEYEVQGIHILDVNKNGKITAAHFEFNSFAGALDTGYTIYYPNGTQFT